MPVERKTALLGLAVVALTPLLLRGGTEVMRLYRYVEYKGKTVERYEWLQSTSGRFVAEFADSALPTCFEDAYDVGWLLNRFDRDELRTCLDAAAELDERGNPA